MSSFVNKKELEIEETKSTFLLSTFKTHMTKVCLVFLLTKLLREGNWPLKKKMPSFCHGMKFKFTRSATAPYFGHFRDYFSAHFANK